MHQCAGILVFHKIRYSKNMNKENKVKKTDKYNKIYKWNEINSAFIFPWRSININVQVSNSYKRNLKVIKCKWTLHSFHCMYW